MACILIPLCLGVAQFAVSAVPVNVNSGPHPRAFLAPAEAGHVRERMDSHGWAAAFGAYLTNATTADMAEPLIIPHAGGQWTHWYTCPNDGGELVAETPTRHVCQINGEVYSGWPYDDVYVTMQHQKWFAHLDSLSVCHLIDPAGGYAERARAILVEYASFYPTLELHNTNGNTEWTQGARLFAQTLEEAVALCRIARAYDFVYEASCFTAQDHILIQHSLIRAMVETIQANDMGRSNIQAWHNAAVGSAGFVLGDASLVDWAVNGASGFLYQMDESVTPSGMWYEESQSYHWYALRAYTYLLEAAERAGMDLYAQPKVKKMFDAPMRQMFPDLTFPPLNDSERTSILNQRKYYELAYRHFGDPAYESLLTVRGTVEAFIWGVDEVPGGSELQRGGLSSNEPSEGLAILRNPGSDTTVYFDYGPGDSPHVHAAKLGIIVYAFGNDRFVDPGHIAYGNPMQDAWFKQTLAHNTVVVNQLSQAKTASTLQAFGATAGFAVVRASNDTAYLGVAIDRTICLSNDSIIDVVSCASELSATFDLPIHLRGDLEDLPSATPCGPIGNTPPYATLQDTRRFTVPLTSAILHAGEGRRIAMHFFDESEAFLAEGLAPDMQGTLPVVMRRQTGTSATFVAVYQMLEAEDEAEVATVEVSSSGIRVTVGGYRLTVDASTSIDVFDGAYAGSTFQIQPAGIPVHLSGDKSLPAVSVPRFSRSGE